jgi:fucose permease
MTGSINYSYVVPLVCFAVITYYAIVSRKMEKKLKS